MSPKKTNSAFSFEHVQIKPDTSTPPCTYKVSDGDERVFSVSISSILKQEKDTKVLEVGYISALQNVELSRISTLMLLKKNLSI